MFPPYIMFYAIHDIREKIMTFFPLLGILKPLTAKISSVILLTVCHIVFVMFVWRIWYWINLYSLNLYFSLFSSLVCRYCTDIVRRNSVLVTHGS